MFDKASIKKMKAIGSHVSAAGGVFRAVDNAGSRGCNETFAFFLSSPRAWKNTLLKPEDVVLFKKKCVEYKFNFEKILPHGSYLINLASNDDEILTKSRSLFHSELSKCKELGISNYNIHPGSAGKNDRTVAIKILADSINAAHLQVPDVVVVVENMSGQGNVLCSDFNEIAELIGKISNKSRVGVCLDTCHLFAAGYDISTKEGLATVIADFDSKVGREYLTAFHLNDSKERCGAKRDLHENLGQGKIGWTPFELLMKDESLENVIFITETPGLFEDSCVEIQRLKSLCE